LIRLAIITTHPVQYSAPLFKYIHSKSAFDIKVFYTWGQTEKGKVYDPGFGREREWDIPLLDGYKYEFIENISTSPGSHHFKGIVNPGLIQAVKKYEADAVLVYGWSFHSHLQVLRYFKGKIPVLFRGDSTLLDEAQGLALKKFARRLFLRWVYSFIDYALYVGTNNKSYYEAVGLKEKNLVYAPHAIDNNRFQEQAKINEQQSVEWKRELGIDAAKLVVLFAGKLEPKKNPLFLIEAAKKLPDLHFIIAGNGVLEKEIATRSEALRNLTLLPFQNQAKMPLVYRLADVFALPSSGPGETWGLAINEAMACGRVVIASNKCGGAIDLIDDGANGYIIHPNAESFIRALTLLATDKYRMAMKKKASLEKIKGFSFDNIFTALEKCLTNI
jgi:glycosyltransferase involved in cell wall biosynthesis